MFRRKEGEGREEGRRIEEGIWVGKAVREGRDRLFRRRLAGMVFMARHKAQAVSHERWRERDKQKHRYKAACV